MHFNYLPLSGCGILPHPALWSVTLVIQGVKVQTENMGLCLDQDQKLPVFLLDPVTRETGALLLRFSAPVLCLRAAQAALPAPAPIATLTTDFAMNRPRQIYKVIFLNQGQIYEIYARQIYQSDLYGFVEVEEFRFGERAQVVVDPSEERLKNEFADVKRSFIPLHAVIRIDEVEKEGIAKVMDAGTSNVTAFPMPFGPGSKGGKS